MMTVCLDFIGQFTTLTKKILYFSFSKNRVKAKGGVASVIANHLRPHTVKVSEGKEMEDEYIIVRLDNVVPAVNIINIYGQQ